MRRRRSKTSSPRRNQLDFTTLECRQLLAGISFDAATGVVVVNGTNQDDAVHIKSISSDQIRVVLGSIDHQVFDKDQVNEIKFNGRQGNDWFRNDTNIPSRAFGHGGDDTLVGGNSRDILRGGPGNDQLTGQNGNDYIAGDEGRNIMFGSAGHDRIIGLWGDDFIWGEAGNDYIVGGAGNDFAHGGTGNDRIFGYNGDDRINGGDGDDYIAGNSGSDWIYGNNGDDRLLGNSGRDEVFGGWGDDNIFGGSDSDDLYGHQGNDRLRGDDGDDDLWGGPQSDRLVGGNGNDDYYEDRFDHVVSDSSDFSSNGDFELRGDVANLNTTAQTFSLIGINVSYSNAEFVANIQNGTSVKAEGTYDGNTLQAREVELEFDNDRNENFEARGVITNINTSAKTFTLFGFTVNYSAARQEGQPVEGSPAMVEGWLTGSQVAAREVAFGTAGDPGGNNGGDDGYNDNGVNGNLEVRGLITNFNASAQSFRVLGLTVDFAGAQLQSQFGNGTFVKVDGAYNGGQINAREVEVEVDDDRDRNFEGRSVIENLNTNSQTFDFLGFTVNYSSARITTPLVNGNSIELDGWFANGTITAEEIKA